MAHSLVHFRSEALEQASSMVVLLPELADAPGPYPVWYILHGLSDDCTTWSRRTTLERQVAGLPLIVVMPDGGRGYYTDNRAGPPWETHFVRDVTGFVERSFPTSDRRVVSGHSMGGYGALRMGLKHPSRFAGVVAHSGAFLIPVEDHSEEKQRIFGPSPAGGPDDIMVLAERAAGGPLPEIRIDCGLEDQFIGPSRQVHEHLERLGIEHEYAEHPGGHTWAYWEERLPETVAFVRRVLRI
jgi:putative tributyrin esterase